MIVFQKYQDLLQPNSCDRFSKILRTFYASRKSWIIVVFLLQTLKERLPIVLINTLLLHIPLLALTHRLNYGGTELQRNKYTRFAWAEGPFFPVVLLCCVSFWFWREIRELALHYFLADCFGIEQEIVFGVTYVLIVQYSCAVVSVFLLWWES